MPLYKFNIIIPPADIQDNPECLERIAAGDREAFEWLYKNYCKKLYDYLNLLSNDNQLAEDLVQDIFLKIWIQREKLTEIKNFNSWIYFTARNRLTDEWRRKQREKEHVKKLYSEEQQPAPNLFDQRYHEQMINTAIKTLTQRQELIYRLIREEGETRDYVSKQLNISPNTVKATMQNALHTLRKQLSEL